MREKHKSENKIDWMITLVPLGIIIGLCVLFFLIPDQSNLVLGKIRFFFGDTLGSYYLIIGLGIFLLSLYVAGSKYGNIVLGKSDEKPQYSFLTWGAMMFTCGLAADILFYSFSHPAIIKYLVSISSKKSCFKCFLTIFFNSFYKQKSLLNTPVFK